LSHLGAVDEHHRQDGHVVLRLDGLLRDRIRARARARARSSVRVRVRSRVRVRRHRTLTRS
jgi:hypothetical protein